jgi:hypothetical protein
VTGDNLTSFSNSSLWFAHVDSFNDPFEGQLIFSFPDYTPGNFEKVLSASISILGDDLIDRFQLHSLKNDPSDFRKLTSTIQLCMEVMSSQNNDHVGVCCFVKRKRLGLLRGEFELQHQHYPNMWSHYGDGLRGFCVEFDGDILLDSLKRLHTTSITHATVQYVSKRTSVDFMSLCDRSSTEKDFFKAAVFFNLLQERNQKHEFWCDEAEFRLNALNRVNKNLQFDPAAIKGVCFGHKMKQDQINALIHIFKALGVQTFSKISPSQSEFSYTVMPL